MTVLAVGAANDVRKHVPAASKTSVWASLQVGFRGRFRRDVAPNAALETGRL